MARVIGHGAATVDNVDHYQVIGDASVGGATVKDVLLDPDTGHKYIAKLGGRNSAFGLR